MQEKSRLKILIFMSLIFLLTILLFSTIKIELAKISQENFEKAYEHVVYKKMICYFYTERYLIFSLLEEPEQYERRTNEEIFIDLAYYNYFKPENIQEITYDQLLKEMEILRTCK